MTERRELTLDVLAETMECGPPCEDDSPLLMEIRAAQMIFIYVLGEEAAKEICLSTSASRRFDAGRRFLRMEQSQKDSDQQCIERLARMLWLAEALYNMQAVPGFDRLVDDIREGNVQAAWEEAGFAMLLAQRQIPFRFLHASTIPGEKTPDLEIKLDGVIIPCEVEGKDEATAATAKSVYNTLEHARKQLPKDAPCLICLKIPELWKGDPAVPIVFKAINRFFHNTDRVVAIIVRSDRHGASQHGQEIIHARVRCNA